ncbi:MAG: ROK family protein [Candidatus Latescibacterota bacterium]|nr:ROK family protein [Candidatus Latescibacterota bacterium]
MRDYVIGFDGGGTRLKSGAVSAGGRIRVPGLQPTGFHMTPPKMMKALTDEVDRISAKMGAKPKAIGIGFAGFVDPQEGVVFLPGKIKGLEGFPIVERLRKAAGVPVVADNDGRLSIYAEASYGLARNLKWAVTITIGTGVGSGVMLDGRILRDPHLGFGTQMSHIVIEGSSGRLCITGARGTAEMTCSATALAMNMRDALQRGIPSVLSDAYFRDPASVDFAAVIRAVEKGDRLAKDELKHWTESLGWLLVSAVHVYAPEVIILSGGASNGAKHFLEPLCEQVNSHLFRYPPGEPVPIVLSNIRNHQGVLGAAALAWELVEPNGTNAD